jgi:hypothetical protein
VTRFPSGSCKNAGRVPMSRGHERDVRPDGSTFPKVTSACEKPPSSPG